MQELNPRFNSDDNTIPPGSALAYWSEVICEASAAYNRPVPYHNELKPWLEEAGFVDVKEVIFKSPTNPWPKSKHLKEVSQFQLLAHLNGLEGISMRLMTHALHWKPDEVSVLLAKIRPELRNRNIHSYQTIVLVYGRKPFGRETPDSTFTATSEEAGAVNRAVSSEPPGFSAAELTTGASDEVEQNDFAPVMGIPHVLNDKVPTA